MKTNIVLYHIAIGRQLTNAIEKENWAEAKKLLDEGNGKIIDWTNEKPLQNLCNEVFDEEWMIIGRPEMEYAMEGEDTDETGN